MAPVKLQEINRKFNNVTAIENINFEVPDGEFWVLVGPSGCGKSTILRTIAGLETATSGNIYIGDTLVNNIPARQRDVAMVFQNYALYPHMTVAQNLAFGLQMRQVEKKVIKERVETVARSLSISHLLDRLPKQLSGGQQQRVALGRAIARQPKVFLLDEPLSNLDAQLRDDTRAELKQLHQKVGITTIYVTHDQVEAMTLADKIVVLNRGKIQQIGDPQSIYHRPANRMVATFLGSPPMNVLPVIYTGEMFQVGEQFLPIPVGMRERLGLKQGQGFDLGIRPEDIRVIEPPRRQERQEDEGELVATVKVLEPLGREILLRVRLDGVDFQVNVQVGGSWRGKVSDRISIQFDLSRLFVFDPTTGDTVYPNL
ncbi:MAG TPA: sugar ABC transporter ATP-binding protein [Cyanobacteria bacterium UBA11369]|nr:sugar ABC transporter ATP-binding protein [Cyanobacteria bacterium UBA11371]HBE32061.1 sugar ABC transporter ATP-binding protein [Cyanobacteria bacterium UBA11368]HBE49233.1 sugar ABC transporter ATP-binding protein [Cyanobacteria bacterium UBA11369]